MKLKYILLSLLLLGAVPGQAQFGKLKRGLKKVKRKKNKVKKKSKKASDKAKSVADGEPAQNDRDPISRAHESAKYKLLSIEKTMAKEGWQKDYYARGKTWIQSYFKETRKSLDRLKANASEAKKPYYKKHEEKYALLKKKFDAAAGGQQAASDYKSSFQQWSSRLSSIDKMSITSEKFIRSVEAVKYVDYKKKKDAYTASGNRTKYADNMIAKCDEFYSKVIDRDMPKIEKVLNGMVEKSYKSSVSTDKEEPWKLTPKTSIGRLKSGLEIIGVLEHLHTSKEPKFGKMRSKLTSEKKKFEEYISSGRYAAYREKLRQEMINSVRLGTVKTRNAQMEALVRQRFSSKGTVLRVVILTSGWTVSKNKYNSIPKYMFHDVSLAIKKADGKCYRKSAQVKKDYLGGGRYGKMFVKEWDNEDEMNCANVNK